MNSHKRVDVNGVFALQAVLLRKRGEMEEARIPMVSDFLETLRVLAKLVQADQFQSRVFKQASVWTILKYQHWPDLRLEHMLVVNRDFFVRDRGGEFIDR